MTAADRIASALAAMDAALSDNDAWREHYAAVEREHIRSRFAAVDRASLSRPTGRMFATTTKGR